MNNTPTLTSGELAIRLGVKRKTILTHLRRNLIPEHLRPTIGAHGKRLWSMEQFPGLVVFYKKTLEVHVEVRDGVAEVTQVPTGVSVVVLTIDTEPEHRFLVCRWNANG